AGRRLFDNQLYGDGLPLLELAMQIRERAAGEPTTTSLELRYLLTLAGAQVQREVVLRHAETTIAGYLRCAGIDVALRWRPGVGRAAAPALGAARGTARWLTTDRERRGPPPLLAYVRCLSVLGNIAAVYGMSFDVDAARRVCETLDFMVLT